MKWYGSLENRLDEGKQFVDEIKVGDGVTEYSWSDRHPYEVVEVKDQRHISIRAYDVKPAGKAYENNWELISNENNYVIKLFKKGDGWFSLKTKRKMNISIGKAERYYDYSF